jgi:hypothetical protein
MVMRRTKINKTYSDKGSKTYKTKATPVKRRKKTKKSR